MEHAGDTALVQRHRFTKDIIVDHLTDVVLEQPKQFIRTSHYTWNYKPKVH